MSDHSIEVAEKTWINIHEDQDGLPGLPWYVVGDLRAPGTGWSDRANYECRDALQEMYPLADFDPESSCFYANTATEQEALDLAEQIKSWVIERRKL